MSESEKPEAFRLLTRPDANADTCLAHRCAEHPYEYLCDQSGPDGSECALCVLDRFADMMVDEVIAPLVAAYATAAQKLEVIGARQHPETRALVVFLQALEQKLVERDFMPTIQTHHKPQKGIH